MSEEKNRHRKYWLLALFGLFIAIIAYALAEEALNQQIAFEFIKNNTNLAPTMDADHPGTGERLTNVTYWANDSTLFVMAFAHANTTSQTAQVNLFVDGVLLLPQSGRPLGGAEEANRSISGFVPKGSNYKYVFTNYHHYEIREWKVLSGRNSTLSINQTGGGCTGDCSFNNIEVNSLGKNDTFNQFGVNIFLNSPFISDNGIKNSILNLGNGVGAFSEMKTTNTSSGYIGDLYLDDTRIQLIVGNGNSSEINLYPTFSEHVINATRRYKYNETFLDLDGAGLANCSNCGTGTDNTKVNKTGDTMTGLLTVKDGAGGLGSSIVNFTDSDNVTRSWITAQGIQYWRFNTTGAEYGYIEYALPGNQPSICFTDSSFNQTNRSCMGVRRVSDNAFRISLGNATVAESNYFILYLNGTLELPRANSTIKIKGLEGAGKAYTCVDSNGILFRGNPTC